MVASISQIIGKINPELYAKNGKELLKKYGSIDEIPAEEIDAKNLAEHLLVYDSSSETLEPVYFFILDLMNSLGHPPEKLVDNFASSPGSGHFQELGTRATIMQQQSSKILGDVNMVLRSILNIIFDLRDFKTRLQSYEDLHSEEKSKTGGAKLSLKQIWMDKVDIAKGNSSIKAMALGQAGFQTLIDAFLVADTEKDVDKIDLNDRIKRILKPRVHEFNIWLKQSEGELRKRYEIEKTYLKSQVNSLKLYSRWARPYLKAAQDLEMKETSREPEIVKAFNTIVLELALLGKSKLKTEDSALEGDLPKEFQKMKMRKEYYSCILVEFKFRGIPQRAGGQQSHYVFGGRAEITFKAYALSDDEIKKMNEELEDSDVSNVLKLIEGSTTESLAQLQDDINFFLEENSEEKPKQKDQSNPFMALIGAYDNGPEKKEKKSSGEKTKIILKPDNWIEKNHLRALVSKKAIDTAFLIFDVYKKAHGMPSYT